MRAMGVSSPKGGSPRASRGSKRICSDDEILRKSRKTMDGHLRRIGQKFGKNLALNSDGMCYFPFQRFIVVVEVPPDDPTSFVLYTMVYRLEVASHSVQVMKKAMELNYMQQATRGSTLGLDGDEVNLCFTSKVGGLTGSDFREDLEKFLLTAAELNNQLEEVDHHAHTPTRGALKSM